MRSAHTRPIWRRHRLMTGGHRGLYAVHLTDNVQRGSCREQERQGEREQPELHDINQYTCPLELDPPPLWGYSLARLSNWALTATMTVLADINTAANAGG